MKPLSARLLLPALLLAVSVPVFSQPAPQVSALLDRLKAYSREYREKLPSLACDESITSHLLKNGKIKKEVKVEAELREIRDDSKPDSFVDHYTFKLVDGRPAKTRFHMPYFVNGAFANGVGFGSVHDQRACFDYQLTEEDNGAILKLELAAKPASADPSCKDVLEGYRKTVLVEAGSGIIRHVTRSMSAEASRLHREPFFASIDYGPQKLGEQTFWLPTRFEARDASGERQMTATFSNYHRYAGELKILPYNALVEPSPTE